jgi:hypoxanthine phosphoribosyltransferase
MSDLATNHKLELFLTRDQIHKRVQQLGEEISRDFTGQPLVMVGVLKGAAIFLADLARAVALDCTFDFISASSYGSDTRTKGQVRVVKELEQSLEKRNVLLVEDILDTGITLCHLQNLMLSQRPARLKIITLLDKPSRRLQKIEVDYVGFTIPNRFVVGYGMDYVEHYRNLPDIYFVPPVIQE